MQARTDAVVNSWAKKMTDAITARGWCGESVRCSGQRKESVSIKIVAKRPTYRRWVAMMAVPVICRR